jgi:hypothetical protein
MESKEKWNPEIDSLLPSKGRFILKAPKETRLLFALLRLISEGWPSPCVVNWVSWTKNGRAKPVIASKKPPMPFRIKWILSLIP